MKERKSKNAMSYLRLLYGREDDAAFERVINIPPRGIGAKTIDIIRAKAARKICPFGKLVKN